MCLDEEHYFYLFSLVQRSDGGKIMGLNGPHCCLACTSSAGCKWTANWDAWNYNGSHCWLQGSRYFYYIFLWKLCLNKWQSKCRGHFFSIVLFSIHVPWKHKSCPSRVMKQYDASYWGVSCVEYKRNSPAALFKLEQLATSPGKHLFLFVFPQRFDRKNEITEPGPRINYIMYQK